MPQRIRLLDETVANRIAAGEVIERPASVIKELLDNAIDAEANRVTIDVERGGKTLMRVSDNGFGMHKDDALLSLERSATSKIRQASDLNEVTSLGFRGEALPSIASVSRFRLHTREAGALSGTEITVDGGKLCNVKETGCPEGTEIEIRSLFSHLPARRKFLKTDTTEWGHIERTVRIAALAHPEITFILRHNGHEVFHLSACKELAQRLGQISQSSLEELIPIEATQGDLSLRGLVGKPGISRSSRSEHYLFVNGRPVQNPALNHGIIEGYRQSLMKGRFPVVYLFLDMDPQRVDVNVHPAKREVRFRDSQRIQLFVAETIAQTIRDFATPRPSPPSPQPSATPPPGSSQSKPSRRITAADLYAPPPDEEIQPEFLSPAQNTSRVKPTQSTSSVPVSRPEEAPAPESNHDLAVLGLLMDHYAVAENDNGLVLVDCRATQERILFERLLRECEQQDMTCQQLLLPLTIDLPFDQAEFLMKNLEIVQHAGIGVSSMGQRTFMVDALPAGLDISDVEEFFTNFLEDFRKSGATLKRGHPLNEELALQALCRSAYRHFPVPDSEELDRLLIDLHRCDLPYTCPQGRPTMIQISRNELDRKFGRT